MFLYSDFERQKQSVQNTASEGREQQEAADAHPAAHAPGTSAGEGHAGAEPRGHHTGAGHQDSRP